MRIASVISSVNAGGVGSVCRYAADGLARHQDWQVTLLCLHDPKSDSRDAKSGLRVVGLGLDGNCPRLFLEWLAANPQDLVMTSDVCRIEPAFPFLPRDTRHVIQIHDSGRRYRDVAVRNASWVDGVTCVGRHIEAPLRASLDEVGFRGLLRTVHNGANFPPLPSSGFRSQVSGLDSRPLRLLFMGGVTALKGVFDLVPLLQRLRKSDVPVTLNIVGGENETLRRQFQRKGLDGLVTWTGRVPHEKCYEIAAESDIFMMTSRKEPFGMVTIEAMSMGCVPIAYDIPSGSMEIIEPGKSGLLVPLGDFRNWAGQIRELHNNRHRLAELSAGAIERARKRFNADIMVRNMAAFVTDVFTHSETHPAERQSGMPPITPAANAQTARGYQRLPSGLREWIRNEIGSRPRLCHWWLNR